MYSSPPGLSLATPFTTVIVVISVWLSIHPAAVAQRVLDEHEIAETIAGLERYWDRFEGRWIDVSLKVRSFRLVDGTPELIHTRAASDQLELDFSQRDRTVWAAPAVYYRTTKPLLSLNGIADEKFVLEQLEHDGARGVKLTQIIGDEKSQARIICRRPRPPNMLGLALLHLGIGADVFEMPDLTIAHTRKHLKSLDFKAFRVSDEADSNIFISIDLGVREAYREVLIGTVPVAHIKSVVSVLPDEARQEITLSYEETPHGWFPTRITHATTQLADASERAKMKTNFLEDAIIEIHAVAAPEGRTIPAIDIPADAHVTDDCDNNNKGKQ